MEKAFLEYFRCPDDLVSFEASGELSAENGYFTFGDATGYGRGSVDIPAPYLNGRMPDLSSGVAYSGRQLRFPFDFSEVVNNLRLEHYRLKSHNSLDKFTASGPSRALYYLARPLLPISVRKHLQRVRLSGWETIQFPKWPVDLSVENLMVGAMAHVLKSRRLRRIPFIWFWPDGAQGCAMMTHDVEGQTGADFCGRLMDVDDSFGIKSAFQIVPENRSGPVNGFLGSIRSRGFEVNLHDLNHDGRLFQNRKVFMERAAHINRYAREMQCQGFRSGAMYREQDWFSAFDFSFDMSVPNAAHLEPQRGGCCTVMPYFVGKILELPLTTIQDYSLFHILGDYSISLWKQQIELILQKNGLISFIIHPDYVAEERAQAVYLDLLAHLSRLRDERRLWVALPGEVDRWWRNRQQMKLVPDGESWRVEGPDSARARVAYAGLGNDQTGNFIVKLEPQPSSQLQQQL
jgi:hypothetical protein